LSTELHQIIHEVIIDARGSVAGAAQGVRANKDLEQSTNRVADAEERARIAREKGVGSYVGPIQSTARLRTEYQKLQASLDPLMAAEMRQRNAMQRAILTTDAAVRRGVAAAGEGANTIKRLREQQIVDLNRVRAANEQLAASHRAGLAAMADNDNFGRGRRQNLGYQAFDIAQGVALGAPLAMIAAQQGPQIAQLYAAQGGLNALWKDATAILGGLARAAGPWLAAAAAIYGAYRFVTASGGEAAFAIDDATRALADQAAPLGSIKGMIADLAGTQKTYTDAISATGTMQDATTALVVASSEREYKAKQQLLEIELKRQRAAIAVQEAEIAAEGYRMKREVAGSITQRPDLVARGFEDPRIGRFVNLPDDITGMERLNEVMAPFLERINEMRARLDLAKISTEQLEAALGVAFQTGASGAALATQRVDAFGGAIDDLSKLAATGMTDLQRATEAYGRAVQAATSLEQEMAATLEHQAALARIRDNALAELARREREVAIGGMSDRDAVAARIRDQNAALVVSLREAGLGEDAVARATAAMNAELALSTTRFDELDAAARKKGLREFEKDANRVAETIDRLLFERSQMFRTPVEQKVAASFRRAGLRINSNHGRRIAARIQGKAENGE